MGIWEGSGNVSALDTLRAMATRPACVEVLFDELGRTAGHDPRLDAHVTSLRAELGGPTLARRHFLERETQTGAGLVTFLGVAEIRVPNHLADIFALAHRRPPRFPPTLCKCLSTVLILG